jgi:hypothetical protein
MSTEKQDIRFVLALLASKVELSRQTTTTRLILTKSVLLGGQFIVGFDHLVSDKSGSDKERLSFEIQLEPGEPVEIDHGMFYLKFSAQLSNEIILEDERIK